ncbi:MAG: PdaC/SigV domain-containing protein [Erythrobacter sp.]
MKFAGILVVMSALMACSSPQEMGEDIASASGESAQDLLDRRVPAGVKPGEIAIENDTYEFAWQWPREAAAIPALDAWMRAQGERTRTDFAAKAAEAEADAQQHDYDYRRHASTWSWEASADTPRLLALVARSYAYTGGAHGNSYFDAMVWDRQGTREEPLETLALFNDVPALEVALREPYCKTLADARLERIGEAGLGGSIPENCPTLGELSVALGTSNGRVIDRLVLLSAPYVVGSYAEGSYEIEVPLDPDMLALVRPAFQSEFGLPD